MSATNRRDLTTLVLIGVLVLWPILMMAFGGMGMMGYGGMTSVPYGGGNGMYGWVGIGLQLIFLLIIIGGGYLLVRRVFDHHESHDEALEEARRAYARGDLSDEEFEARRSRLQSKE